MSETSREQMRRPRSLLSNMDIAPISKSDAQSLIERSVKMSKADSINVQVNDGTMTNLRFADNRVTTAGRAQDSSVVVISSYGPKHAAVQTNDLSDDGLRRAVEQSEALAKLAPDDPEAMPELGPQQYGASDAYFASTAEASADERARAAMTALDPARASGNLKAAGYLEVHASAAAMGNNKGLFGYYPFTTANYTLTVRSSDGTGSGWSGAEVNDWKNLDFAALGKHAIEKALASRSPVAIEPGRYTVVMEPQAVGDIVQLIGGYVGAREADEGRSPFVKTGGGNKIGMKVVDSRVSIISDPSDPALRGQPFDGDGLPLGRQVWIENGVLKNLYYTRFWAKKQNAIATGSPSTFKMTGGSTSVEDMIRSTERGVLVTRLWYLREVDPRTILYTGLTRDGTFLIENGKISRSIKNFRFNDSPLFMLNNVETLGVPVRIGGTEAGGPIVVPAVKAKDFDFTSLSDAV
ncbi:MAG: TldD/PmbA family protein [Gemmatimonadota bacterium]|nr:TldD/PmbA family protein [Gemmatimonadota bacterium]